MSDTQVAEPTAQELDSQELRLGDRVIIMAEPGPFTIVEIDPPCVVIESNFGVRRKVHEGAVRKVTDTPPTPR